MDASGQKAQSLPDRYAHIDSLRAIAALLVLWMHVSDVFASLDPSRATSPSALEFIPSWFDFGRVGVLIFFLISGFLIPSSLKGGRYQGAKTFVLRRFFRLYPLYWLSIPLSVFSMWWLFDRPVTFEDIELNFTMLQDKLGGTSLSGLYWTLRLELFFYAICLALFVANVLKNEKVIVFLAVCPAPIYVLNHWFSGHKLDVWGVWTQDLAFLSVMFVGTLWRRLHDGQISKLGLVALTAISLWFVVGFPLGALSLYLRHGNLMLDQSRFFSAYPLATMIFFAGAMLFRIRFRPLVWTGKISYSIYLLHPVLFYTVYWYLVHLPADNWMRNQYLGIYIVGIALLTFGVSSITFLVIERPMMNFGAWLTSRRPTASADGSQAPLSADGAYSAKSGLAGA
jgi:peptidoglycan/LPS O-acetylase OafA/YrhL